MSAVGPGSGAGHWSDSVHVVPQNSHTLPDTWIFFSVLRVLPTREPIVGRKFPTGEPTVGLDCSNAMGTNGGGWPTGLGSWVAKTSR